SPPLPPGEGWGEGKRTSELIEKTGSDSSYFHARPVSRRPGEGRLGSYTQERIVPRALPRFTTGNKAHYAKARLVGKRSLLVHGLGDISSDRGAQTAFR
ncbi:MAG TPA: hypothetical protein PLS55_01650, partial [Thermogutta sp.]|nr:hypothetical protein [Thermogutta sp.]